MTNITKLRPGERFSFKGFDWICLDPNSKDGGVFAIMSEPWKEDVKFCPDKRYADEKGNWNNYRTSLIREVLNDSLADTLGRDNLLLHEVDLIADNGDRSYGTVKDPVFLITCDEYRKYREFIPRYDDQIWTATPWWCGDKDSGTGNAYRIRSVHTAGQLYGDAAYSGGSAVPACILNPASLNLRQSVVYVNEVSE